MIGYETVAAVSARNGAWLVQLVGSATDDLVPNELFDAASSLAKARRLARAGAEGIGYVTGVWTIEAGVHYLEGSPEL